MGTWLLASALATLALLLVLLCVVSYHLALQQGRLLLRLDALEQRLGTHRPSFVTGADDGELIGTLLPSFELPDLTDGRLAKLEDFRGRRTLLINWSRSCIHCQQVAATLSEVSAELSRRNIDVILISEGEVSDRQVDSNYPQGCRVLLRSGVTGVAAFEGNGTPSAYALDEHGKVTAPLAVGSDQVSALARQLAGCGEKRGAGLRLRPLSESRLQRHGLRRGAAAPAFTLPDLRGRLTSLSEFRGRRVLLIFVDPSCGPCDRLIAGLSSMAQPRAREFAVLIVSRGDVAANRRKVEAVGYECPVLLQPAWRISRAYGTFETPVAFLVDRDGIIARDVIRGTDDILQVARMELLSSGD